MSIKFLFAAVFAGSKPKMIPTASEIKKANIKSVNVVMLLNGSKRDKNLATINPRKNPIIPPIVVSINDSSKN